ncbi:hypothetical protein RhiJN_25983 [Ceratobasidium sp. AG-Ba]|nr:hypothetical protein RhiJN_25983 [Ceratobasidium sp. AG-Ba]
MVHPRQTAKRSHQPKERVCTSNVSAPMERRMMHTTLIRRARSVFYLNPSALSPISTAHITNYLDFYSMSDIMPLAVRTCPGCRGVFKRRKYLRHVRNDCGNMISVDELLAALQEILNRTGADSIDAVELSMAIERVAVRRPITHGNPEGDDIEVVSDSGRRMTLSSFRQVALDRAARRRERRLTRALNSLANDLHSLHM